MTDTANAPERKVFDEWFQDTFKDPDGSLEHLPKWFLEDAWLIWKASATHHDELVAAAYLDAARVPTGFLVGDPPNGIPLRNPMAHEVAEAIKAQIPDDARAALTARDERMKAEGAREAQAKIARLTEALTPSGDTKAAYMSEFEFIVFGMNDDGEECSHKITVPWTAIKEIMAAIKARAAIQENANE